MKLEDLKPFTEIWFVDFEFGADPGANPKPICLVARELRTCKTIRIWEDELRQLRRPPYGIGKDALFIAYYSSAEFGCHLVQGWDLPENVIDLFAEFRTLTNGRELPNGAGLVGALSYFELDSMATEEKTKMRELALRGGPWTGQERSDLLDYCESDVIALAHLLPKMLPYMDSNRALVRGRYMKAAARIENNGVPLDMEKVAELREAWPHIQDDLIKRIDQQYGVYEGKSFRMERFEKYLIENNIPWPKLPSGDLALDEETFREMAKACPAVAPLRELRVSLSKLRLESLTIGPDGRNRTLISAFQSKTGRNQPSNSKFIFGPSVWMRGLIKPKEGHALAYIDYSQQEFAIAAALSGDEKMKEAYSSGDPYLAFAKQAGAVPQDATRDTPGVDAIRDLYKACALAVQYGMGETSLASRLGVTALEARELLRKHHDTYPVFWRWSDAAVDHAMLFNSLSTVFGWTLNIGPEIKGRPANPRSLRNFPMQANGAEMLRLACILATEAGVQIAAPVHDALLIEAPTHDLEESIRLTRQAMADASRIVLGGFEVRTDVKEFRYPARYMDKRGEKMWEHVEALVGELKNKPA